jgi:hypothetical protein
MSDSISFEESRQMEHVGCCRTGFFSREGAESLIDAFTVALSEARPDSAL